MSCPARTIGVAALMAALACPAFVNAQQAQTATLASSSSPDRATAEQPKAETVPPSTEEAPRKPLNLRAPDITQLFSQQELQRVLAKTIDPDIEEVEVEGARDRSLPLPNTPTGWPGILAPFWALTHPTQAWRIFAPLPPDQARRIGNTAPDATDPYRRPVQPLP